MENTLLKAINIKKSYGTVQVLKDVSIEVFPKEVVSIVGSSGAGKSTLLHILGTLDLPDQGALELYGKSLQNQKPTELAKFRNKNIGFVFQFHNLLPEFTALENVLIPGYIAGTDSKKLKADGVALLKRLGLEDRAHHKPSELSGGEQQRIAVARALINAPALVLADEPSGNLDSKNAVELHHLFFELRRELGQTFVIVTHNKDLAAMSDRVIELKDGRVLR